MEHWIQDRVFYHIYPLGFCGAPARNDFSSTPTPRMDKITTWLDHIRSVGCNALYLGPVFEATTHGYDTVDYYTVDRRLGTLQDLSLLSQELHRRGMRLVLDGVFNHVGRDFWAFKDVLARGADSAYANWFHLDFSRHSPYGDPFSYESWQGFYELVKLNLKNPEVRSHLFGAVSEWIQQVSIDGLRLDAADCIDPQFLQALSAHCRTLRPDFWLMGEVVLDDYRKYLACGLDATTNYEVYKSLYSSHADRNFFEIAYALNRQSGSGGIYKDHWLYNFADNHDVNRVAAQLSEPAHLYSLYCLLFTIPGVPSIYYGSEWGLNEKKSGGDDRPLRPNLDLAALHKNSPQPELPAAIARLAAVRGGSPALQSGSYTQLHVAAQQLAFLRQAPAETMLVIVNAAEQAVMLPLNVPTRGSRLVDLLNPGAEFELKDGQAVVSVPPAWGRILQVR